MPVLSRPAESRLPSLKAVVRLMPEVSLLCNERELLAMILNVALKKNTKVKYERCIKTWESVADLRWGQGNHKLDVPDIIWFLIKLSLGGRAAGTVGAYLSALRHAQKTGHLVGSQGEPSASDDRVVQAARYLRRAAVRVAAERGAITGDMALEMVDFISNQHNLSPREKRLHIRAIRFMSATGCRLEEARLFRFGDVITVTVDGAKRSGILIRNDKGARGAGDMYYKVVSNEVAAFVLRELEHELNIGAPIHEQSCLLDGWNFKVFRSLASDAKIFCGWPVELIFDGSHAFRHGHAVDMKKLIPQGEELAHVLQMHESTASHYSRDNEERVQKFLKKSAAAANELKAIYDDEEENELHAVKGLFGAWLERKKGAEFGRNAADAHADSHADSYTEEHEYVYDDEEMEEGYYEDEECAEVYYDDEEDGTFAEGGDADVGGYEQYVNVDDDDDDDYLLFPNETTGDADGVVGQLNFDSEGLDDDNDDDDVTFVGASLSRGARAAAPSSTPSERQVRAALTRELLGGASAPKQSNDTATPAGASSRRSSTKKNGATPAANTAAVVAASTPTVLGGMAPATQANPAATPATPAVAASATDTPAQTPAPLEPAVLKALQLGDSVTIAQLKEAFRAMNWRIPQAKKAGLLATFRANAFAPK